MPETPPPISPTPTASQEDPGEEQDQAAEQPATASSSERTANDAKSSQADSSTQPPCANPTRTPREQERTGANADSSTQPASHAAPPNSPAQPQATPQPIPAQDTHKEQGYIPPSSPSARDGPASPAARKPVETIQIERVRGAGGRFEPLKPVEPPKAQPIALLNSPKPAEDNDLGRRDTRIGGLDDIPKLWPDLAANVSTSVETAWVQANRLLVVKETSSGRVKVDLSKARSPAPSLGTLFWLETAIKNPAKFVEIASKQASSGQDEAEFVRRERMQVAEIRSILEEMRVDKQS